MTEPRLWPFWEMCKGRWREFVREPSAFFFVLFMPLSWMAILGAAFSHPQAPVAAIGWYDAAPRSPTMEVIYARLSLDAGVRVAPGDQEAMATLLKRGEIQLVVEPKATAIEYVYDPANKEALRTRAVVDDLIQEAAGRVDRVAKKDRQIAVPGTRYIEFLVPGLLALSIMTSSLFGTGAVLVASRRENLLKRYLVTPMQPLQYLGSHIVGRGLILAVETGAILVGGWCMFHFRVSGSLIDLCLFAVLGAAAFTAIAVLCASRTSNMAVLNGVTNIISLPMMLVAGVWFARSNFPAWIGDAARFLPLTVLVDGLRRIALEGAALSSLGFEAAVLAAYLVVGTLTARAVFKWY